MQVTITTRHLELTPDVKARAEARIGKIAHFSDNLGDVAVVLWNERHLFHAELRTRADGQDLVSTADGEDLRTAIDAAAAKLERQVKDQRDRLQQRATKVGAEPARGPESPA